MCTLLVDDKLLIKNSNTVRKWETPTTMQVETGNRCEQIALICVAIVRLLGTLTASLRSNT